MATHREIVRKYSGKETSRSFKPAKPHAGAGIVITGPAMFEGTKMLVADVLDELAVGNKLDQVIKKHPELTEENIRAALRCAAFVIHDHWERSKRVKNPKTLPTIKSRRSRRGQ